MIFLNINYFTKTMAKLLYEAAFGKKIVIVSLFNDLFSKMYIKIKEVKLDIFIFCLRCLNT